MSLAVVQSAERFLRAQLVQGLGGLSSANVHSLGVAGVVVEQRPDGLVDGGVRVGFRRGASHGLRRGGPRGLGRSLVRFLDDVVPDEAIAVPLHRSDEGRRARIVAQRASEDPDGLAQGAVGDHHVAPDRVENLAPRHRLVAPLDEHDEQVEAARHQRQLSTVADERPPAGGQGVTGEPVARWAGRRAHRRPAVYVALSDPVACRAARHRSLGGCSPPSGRRAL